MNPTPKQITAWITRNAKDIEKRSDDRARSYIGRDAGHGYAIVATDGHRAILKRTDPTTEGAVVTCMTDHDRSVELDPSEYLCDALKRMRAANSDKRKGWTAITINAEDRTVALATRDEADGTEAREWLPIRGALVSRRIAANIGYLQQMLSLPCVQFFPGDGKRVMVAATPCDTYRIVVMPVATQKLLAIEQEYSHDAEEVPALVTA